MWPRQYRETRQSDPDKETNSDHPGKNIQADTEQAPHPLSAGYRGPHLLGATNQTDKINGQKNAHVHGERDDPYKASAFGMVTVHSTVNDIGAIQE